MSSRFIHAVALHIPLCVHTTFCLLFISQWILGLLPLLGYCITLKMFLSSFFKLYLFYISFKSLLICKVLPFLFFIYTYIMYIKYYIYYMLNTFKILFLYYIYWIVSFFVEFLDFGLDFSDGRFVYSLHLFGTLYFLSIGNKIQNFYLIQVQLLARMLNRQCCRLSSGGMLYLNTSLCDFIGHRYTMIDSMTLLLTDETE